MDPYSPNILHTGAQRPPAQAQTAPAQAPIVARGMDQNEALNTMVNFLNVSQKRGIFTFEESAKIWECLKAFGAK